VFLILKIK